MSIEELTIYPMVKIEILLDEFENGARPKGGVGQIEEGVPSLGGEHLTADGGFRFENARYISEKFFRSMKKGIVRHQDILIVKDGATTGKVAFVRQDFPFEHAAINEHLFRLRAKPELVEPEYLFWFLFSEWGQAQIQRSFQGGAIGGINRSFVKRVDVPLPPLPEQRRIVAILRKADELRRLRQRANQRARDLLPALFYAMFGDISPTGQPPSNWHVSPIGEYCADTQYGLSSSLTDESGSEIGVLRMNNISIQGEIDLSDLKYLPADKVDFAQYDLREGDILFNRTNSKELVGKTGLWRSSFGDNFTFASYIIRVRLKEGLLPEYLWAALNSPYGKAQMKRLAKQAGNMANINTDELASIKIPIPPIEKQEKFREHLKYLDVHRKSVEQTEYYYTNLIDSLLARAFTGELTAAWREAHAEELRAAAAERDRLLGSASRLQAVESEAEEELAAQPVSPNGRARLVAALSPGQRRLLATIQERAGYTTAEMLAEETGLPTDSIHRGLGLLTAAGLVQAVSLSTQPTGDETVYVSALRALCHGDDSRLDDMDQLWGPRL